MAQEQRYPEFAELHSVHPVSAVAALLEVSCVNVQVYAGAEEPTRLLALSSC